MLKIKPKIPASTMLVSLQLVSFRYQLKRLCNVLSWSVSLRYQMVHRYDVSNWSVLFTCQSDVAKTSQIGPSHWHTSWDVVMMFQHGPGRSNLSVKWVNFFWVLSSTFFSISGGSVLLRSQLLSHFHAWKTPVSFTY